MESPKTHGFIESKDALLTRLRRVRGQIGGLERMVEEERYCMDVLTQISAAQAALDKVALSLLDDHVKHCVLDATDEDRAERTDELMAAVSRLMSTR